MTDWLEAQRQHLKETTWASYDVAVRRITPSLGRRKLKAPGMRRGEVLGLRWSDIDLDTAQLAILQTVTTVNYQPIVTTPKTKRSRRVIYLDEHTTGVLRSHRRQQYDEKRTAGAAWSDSNDLVFRDDLGDLINPDWFSAEFARQVKASGLPKIRFHDLRHSYATLALKAGVHPKMCPNASGTRRSESPSTSTRT